MTGRTVRFVLVLLLLAAAAGAAHPLPASSCCPDECDGGAGGDCLACAGCTLGKPPAIVEDLFVWSFRASPFEGPGPTIRLERLDPEDVFHVPKRPA